MQKQLQAYKQLYYRCNSYVEKEKMFDSNGLISCKILNIVSQLATWCSSKLPMRGNYVCFVVF